MEHVAGAFMETTIAKRKLNISSEILAIAQHIWAAYLKTKI
jgi:hypothetical protein